MRSGRLLSQATTPSHYADCSRLAAACAVKPNTHTQRSPSVPVSASFTSRSRERKPYVSLVARRGTDGIIVIGPLYVLKLSSPAVNGTSSFLQYISVKYMSASYFSHFINFYCSDLPSLNAHSAPGFRLYLCIIARIDATGLTRSCTTRICMLHIGLSGSYDPKDSHIFGGWLRRCLQTHFVNKK
jgi:hypothetical protein